MYDEKLQMSDEAQKVSEYPELDSTIYYNRYALWLADTPAKGQCTFAIDPCTGN